MDAEPKALRPYILLSTTLVVLGVVAGYGVWHLAATRSNSESLLPSAADSGVPRVVDFPAGTSVEERTRIAALVGRLTSGPAPTGPASDARDLLALGKAAVPALLTELHRVVTGPEAREPAAQARLASLDRLLGLVRAGLEPTYVPVAWPANPDTAAIDRRVRSWFAWWDAVAPTPPTRAGDG